MRYLIIFLLGSAAGAGMLYYAQQSDQPAHVAERVKETAVDAHDAVAGKLVDWKLTPEDIRQDLAKGGQIVRNKAAVAGERIADARIVTVVNAKLVLDRDLSAIDINVDCRDGDVTLKGTVSSAGLVGRAMALSLDTSGVRTVTSHLSVTSAK